LTHINSCHIDSEAAEDRIRGTAPTQPAIGDCCAFNCHLDDKRRAWHLVGRAGVLAGVDQAQIGNCTVATSLAWPCPWAHAIVSAARGIRSSRWL
jgi:hypothetical protein